MKEFLNLVEYFRSYGQLKSITRLPTTAQMESGERVACDVKSRTTENMILIKHL